MCDLYSRNWTLRKYNKPRVSAMDVRTYSIRHIVKYAARSIFQNLACWYQLQRPISVAISWVLPLHWRHNEHDGVSNHRRLYCLLNSVFRRRSQKTSKLCVTGPCEDNSQVIGEFPAQRASNAENVSIWWRGHIFDIAATVGNIICNHEIVVNSLQLVQRSITSRWNLLNAL